MTIVHPTTSNCEICNSSSIQIAVHEYDQGCSIRTLNYCGPMHALLGMLKRYGKLIKCQSSTSTVKGYLAATTALEKLSKSLEREIK